MVLEITDRVIRQACQTKAADTQLLSCADISGAVSALGLAAFNVFASSAAAPSVTPRSDDDADAAAKPPAEVLHPYFRAV